MFSTISLFSILSASKNLLAKLLVGGIIRRMNEERNTPNNSEIEKVLKEFEDKNPEQTQKVSEISAVRQKKEERVEFEIPSYGAVKHYSETDTPKIVKLVVKFSGGVIKEQKQAEYILLGFVVVAIGTSLFLVFGGGSNNSINKLPIYQEDLTPTARATIPADILKTIPYRNAK